MIVNRRPLAHSETYLCRYSEIHTILAMNKHRFTKILQSGRSEWYQYQSNEKHSVCFTRSVFLCSKLFRSISRWWRLRETQVPYKKVVRNKYQAFSLLEYRLC